MEVPDCLLSEVGVLICRQAHYLMVPCRTLTSPQRQLCHAGPAAREYRQRSASASKAGDYSLEQSADLVMSLHEPAAVVCLEQQEEGL